jgi:hypothetical protein
VERRVGREWRTEVDLLLPAEEKIPTSVRQFLNLENEIPKFRNSLPRFSGKKNEKGQKKVIEVPRFREDAKTQSPILIFFEIQIFSLDFQRNFVLDFFRFFTFLQKDVSIFEETVASLFWEDAKSILTGFLVDASIVQEGLGSSRADQQLIARSQLLPNILQNLDSFHESRSGLWFDKAALESELKKVRRTVAGH